VSNRVVALGGGHGLAVVLQALRTVTEDITAIVSIADDGGSSGELRSTMGIAPPGDARRCVGALSGDEVAEILEHRFSKGPWIGHPVGNVILAGLLDAGWSPEIALKKVGTLFGITGRVIPATNLMVELVAETPAGTIRGQRAISESGTTIQRLRFEANDLSSPTEALDAIEHADHVVIGPGSLFTSLLAVAALPEINRALCATDAPITLVLNLGTDAETKGMSGDDYLAALERHDVIVNTVIEAADAELGVDASRYSVVAFPLNLGGHHDPQLLAAALQQSWSRSDVRL
jgi:uncharacterized cofD-like protein